MFDMVLNTPLIYIFITSREGSCHLRKFSMDNEVLDIPLIIEIIKIIDLNIDPLTSLDFFQRFTRRFLTFCFQKRLVSKYQKLTFHIQFFSDRYLEPNEHKEKAISETETYSELFQTSRWSISCKTRYVRCLTLLRSVVRNLLNISVGDFFFGRGRGRGGWLRK